MVRIQRRYCCGPGSIPGWGTPMSCKAWPKRRASLGVQMVKNPGGGEGEAPFRD